MSSRLVSDGYGEKMQVTPLKGKKMGGLKAANAYFC